MVDVMAQEPPVGPDRDRYSPIDARVTDPAGQTYLVRAVRRGLPLREFSTTGDIGQALISVLVTTAMESLADRRTGWVVGVLRDRGWRAAKKVHREIVPDEGAADARVRELADRIQRYGVEMALR